MKFRKSEKPMDMMVAFHPLEERFPERLYAQLLSISAAHISVREQERTSKKNRI